MIPWAKESTHWFYILYIYMVENMCWFHVVLSISMDIHWYIYMCIIHMSIWYIIYIYICNIRLNIVLKSKNMCDWLVSILTHGQQVMSPSHLDWYNFLLFKQKVRSQNLNQIIHLWIHLDSYSFFLYVTYVFIIFSSSNTNKNQASNCTDDQSQV